MTVPLQATASVLAEAADQLLVGTDHNDTLFGGAGNDSLYGLAGDDVLFGRPGSDLLVGGAGSDTLVGEAGSDDIWGWDYGDYNAYGYPKDPDTVRYDLGECLDLVANLEISGGPVGSVTFVGAPGETDTLHLIENFWSGGGNDLIHGSSVANELRGGLGSDTLFGEDGDDTLFGQAGWDRFDGGSGLDIVAYSNPAAGIRADLATGRVWLPGQRSESLVSIEGIIGGNGNDTLMGSAADNVLDGGFGSDTMSGRGGFDTVSFESSGFGVSVDLSLQQATTAVIGEVYVDALSSIEGAVGGSVGDGLRGGGGANRLDGGPGDDLVQGAGGNDAILLSSGSDTLVGGAGSDTLLWQPTYQTFRGLTIDFLDTYYDYIKVYDGDRSPDSLVDLRHGYAADYTAEGLSRLSGIENFSGGVGNDLVLGDDRANVISVGHGANVVDAGGGDDSISGSGDLSDPAVSPRGSDVDEREAFEILSGGDGNDTISGGTAMYGDDGDDVLVAPWRSGKPMTGGAGADSFEFTAEYWTESYPAGNVAYKQYGFVADFNGAEGDRLVVDWSAQFGDTPPPQFAGYDVADLGFAQFTIRGDTLYLGCVEVSGQDYDFYDGLTVHAPGLQAADVFFV